jgi:hypothetical protein
MTRIGAIAYAKGMVAYAEKSIDSGFGDGQGLGLGFVGPGI